jgi:hypothetical protein
MDSPHESTDSQAVEASHTADATEPQPAPERRLTPVAVLPKRTAERSRRATLVSPIPALMAASMREPVDVANTRDTSPHAVLSPGLPQPTGGLVHEDRESLPFDSEEDDYVVELDASKQEA